MIHGMESDLASNLRTWASRFAAARKIELTTLGRLAAADWRFFERLDDPDRTFTARKYDEVMKFFSVEWPPDVEWPPGVPRPDPRAITRNNSRRNECAVTKASAP